MTAVSFDYIHKVVNDPIFQAEYNIKISKTNICIQHNDLFI